MSQRFAEKKLYLISNLEYLLIEHKIDLKNLAVATGVPAPTLSRIKREGANPTIATLIPLLDFFRVDLDSLLYEDLKSNEYQQKEAAGKLCHVPVISLDEPWHKRGRIERFLSISGVNEATTFAMDLNTNAFAPTFHKGSTLLLDRALSPIDGDYVLCLINNSEKPHFRQYFLDVDTVYFKPLNPEMGTMKTYEDYEVLGVVVKSIEHFR